MTKLLLYALRGITIVTGLLSLVWLIWAVASASFAYAVVTFALIFVIMILSWLFREEQE